MNEEHFKLGCEVAGRGGWPPCLLGPHHPLDPPLGILQ